MQLANRAGRGQCTDKSHGALACKAEKVHVKEEVVELLASRDEEAEDYVHLEVVVHLTCRD